MDFRAKLISILFLMQQVMQMMTTPFWVMATQRQNFLPKEGVQLGLRVRG